MEVVPDTDIEDAYPGNALVLVVFEKIVGLNHVPEVTALKHFVMLFHFAQVTMNVRVRFNSLIRRFTYQDLN